MAHSIEIYRGKSIINNDIDLLVFMGFGICIMENSDKFYEISELGEWWRQSMRQYGPGIIDLKLDSFLKKPEIIRKFTILLSAVLEQASQYGETIPSDVVKELILTPYIVPGAEGYNLSYLVEVVSKLRVLVADN